jgi:hypothetical protein
MQEGAHDAGTSRGTSGTSVQKHAGDGKLDRVAIKRGDLGTRLVTRGDAKIDYRRFARV